MKTWKKPVVIEYDIKALQNSIVARAYSVGAAMSIGALCDQGVGARGVVMLPDGTIAEAFVAAKNEAEHLYTLVINGITRFWNWLTNIFS